MTDPYAFKALRTIGEAVDPNDLTEVTATRITWVKGNAPDWINWTVADTEKIMVYDDADWGVEPGDGVFWVCGLFLPSAKPAVGMFHVETALLDGNKTWRGITRWRWDADFIKLGWDQYMNLMFIRSPLDSKWRLKVYSDAGFAGTVILEAPLLAASAVPEAET